MKVICAGMAKTGTKTMVAALHQLGYNVYDFAENYEYLRDDWMKIFKEGGTVEDFRRMFENVDAVTDLPAAYFWDEIHKAYPDAKIILTLRESEDVWYRSMVKQIEMISKPSQYLINLLSPTMRKLTAFGKHQAIAVFGWESSSIIPFRKPKINETHIRMTYRRHNAHVLQDAPKDKLLVYSVKEGWGPLCKFLGKEEPSTPFPHENIGGKIVDELFAKNPVFIRMKREAAVSASLVVALTLYGLYKLACGSTPVSWASYWSNGLMSLLTKCGLITE